MSRVPTNSVSHRARQATYRERRKAGLVPAVSPWNWLSQADVQRLAGEAYRLATYDYRGLDDSASNAENFTRGLQEIIEVLIADAAAAAGVPAAPFGASDFAKSMRVELPADWRPQYPVFISAQA